MIQPETITSKCEAEMNAETLHNKQKKKQTYHRCS